MRSKWRGLISAAIMVGVLLSASCSTPPSTPSAPGQGSAKPYGSLTIGMDLGSGQIDPQFAPTNTYMYVSNTIFDNLVYYDVAGKLQPGIGERWEISPDGMTHTWYIRKGVKFHDGSDLTAADVKYSIERMMAPQSLVSASTVLRNAIASVEAKDDYTVVVHMKTPQFVLLSFLEANLGSVVPKKYIEEKGEAYFRQNFVGSGPWKFVKFVPGDRLELEAVENHWRTVPKFKNLTLLHVKDDATKVPLLKTGELDMAQITPESAPGLKSAGLRILNWYGGAQYFAFAFYDMNNPGKYALGDVRVRKALQLGINSQEIADKILGGYGEPYPFFGADSAADFWDSNVLKLDPFDPEGAKKLLSDAGYPNGFDTRIYDIGAGGIVSTINQALSGYWRKIGVSAATVPIEYGAMVPMFVPKQVTEIWNSFYTTLGSQIHGFEKMASTYHSTRGSLKNIKNLKLDDLIDKVPSVSDPAERKRLALEAVLLAKNEYSGVKIVAAHTVVAVGARIGDLTPYKDVAISGLLFETAKHAK